jgi:Leucine-rich repeat (LRR) protein
MMTEYIVDSVEGIYNIPSTTTVLIIRCYIDFSVVTINFPPALEELYGFHIYLKQLPDNLPPTLQVLNCSCNQLTRLPNTLPPILRVLICSWNQLTRLPDSLPSTLQKLYCDSNQLTHLPSNLPQTLQVLSCSNNQLTWLPNVSQTIRSIYTGGNMLPPYLSNTKGIKEFQRGIISCTCFIIIIIKHPQRWLPLDMIKLIWREMTESLKN